METLRVGTYNCAFTMPDHVFIDDLDRLLPQVDIIGFQEFGDSNDSRNLKRAAAKHGFTVVRKDTPLPIAFRTDAFVLLDSGAHWLSPKKFVGEPGAGPNTLAEKHLAWVKVKHKASGRKFYFGNCHLAPSIYLKVRELLHTQQTTNIAKWIQSKRNNVIVVGDFNIDHKQDARVKNPKMPYVKFGRINVVSTFRTLGLPSPATHGKRYIDYVFYRKIDRRFKAVKHKVLRGYSSDHKPLIAEFAVKKRIFKK